MQKWVLAAKKADFNKIAQQFKIDPVTAALITNRGLEGDEKIHEYLHGDLSLLNEPSQMKDIAKAVELLKDKIKQEQKIRIIGDYDVDGVMSTYILQQGLCSCGAKVDYAIPHRVTDGYGINNSLIEIAIADGVDTIVTCDNGISAVEQIAYAKDNGLTVIVTDHHEIPETLPEADAIINPKQADCAYPFKELCGAAVAYKVMIELYRHFDLDAAKHEEFLEYVAMATIADVMDLVGENRILVKEGLKRLQNTTNIGLQELIKANNLELGNISPYHIGFVLGPCINASGRLDVAARALELFNATSMVQAATIAGELKSLNESRKEMTVQGVNEAVATVENSSLKADRVLVAYLPNCHESLAGIIAGRLRERYYKPTIILTDSGDGIKGSGRSIAGYSMYDELVKCQELFEKFGGHPMAAGLSLKDKNDIPKFRKKINELCKLTEEGLTEKIVIDVAMPLSYISPKLINEMEVLQPFGKGNNKPVFARKHITIHDYRIFGKNNNVLKAKAVDEDGFVMDAIYFGENEELVAILKQQRPIAITYYPTINSYNGRDTLQVVISHFQ